MYGHNKIDRVGEVAINNQGLKMEIIGYRSGKDLDIEFEDGVIVKGSNYSNFKKGSVKNYNHREICGVGYAGYGKYITRGKNKDYNMYNSWKSMLNRCYNSKTKEKNTSYANCKVCEEWHSYQNFAKWYEENKWDNELELCVDKDILIKNNKTYSPSSCILVTRRINSLFVNRKKSRGNYALGVNKRGKIYLSRCGDGEGGREHIGAFSTEKEAFEYYKEFKENVFKRVADEYRIKYPNFPQKVYDAMYNYKVEIDD